MVNEWGEELLPIGTKVRFIDEYKYKGHIFKIKGYDHSVYKDFANMYIVEYNGATRYIHYSEVEEVPINPPKTVRFGVGKNKYWVSGATTLSEEGKLISQGVVLKSNGCLFDVIDMVDAKNGWYIDELGVAFKVVRIEEI